MPSRPCRSRISAPRSWSMLPSSNVSVTTGTPDSTASAGAAGRMTAAPAPVASASETTMARGASNRFRAADAELVSLGCCPLMRSWRFRAGPAPPGRRRR
ncbi:hypothetical protein ACFPRL_22050 [Pseudoclavibacter helvolus]